MKRIIIICEGPTEKEFCENVLYNYFFPRNIVIEAVLIKKTGGGIVGWDAIKSQINRHIYENAFVTLFLDYYGIKDKHNFPNWENCKEAPSIYDKIQLLNESMTEDIKSRYFIPYIQLHEFESLLFSSIDSIQDLIPPDDLNLNQLIQIFQQFDNPELINSGILTSPSKRIEQCIIGYNKVVHGQIIADCIGLDIIREKCINFNNWITKIENI